MQTVWKQVVSIDGEQAVSLPDSSRVVRVEHAPRASGEDVWVWYVVTDTDPQRRRIGYRWELSATGQPVPAPWVYLGSTPPHGVLGLVWHLWEVHGG